MDFWTQTNQDYSLGYCKCFNIAEPGWFVTATDQGSKTIPWKFVRSNRWSHVIGFSEIVHWNKRKLTKNISLPSFRQIGCVKQHWLLNTKESRLLLRLLQMYEYNRTYWVHHCNWPMRQNHPMEMWKIKQMKPCHRIFRNIALK